jgi:hypothetical protein
MVAASRTLIAAGWRLQHLNFAQGKFNSFRCASLQCLTAASIYSAVDSEHPTAADL